MLLYFIIFTSKVIENAIGTLRIIVIANGKKILGAILQGIIAIIWIFAIGLVVTNVIEDPFKVIAFALGSIVGSYLGSYLEEKIALGNNLLTVIIDNQFGETIINKIRNHHFAVTSMTGEGKETEKTILFIFVPRKKVNEILNIIKAIDSNALIISENAYKISGGYLQKKIK